MLTYFYFNTSSIIITAIIGSSPGVIGTYIAAATFGILIPAAIILSFLILFLINFLYLYCETKIVNSFVKINNNQSNSPYKPYIASEEIKNNAPVTLQQEGVQNGTYASAQQQKPNSAQQHP